jgi:hypothetical protein
MKYTHTEVIDIIKSITDKNPEELLELWVNKKSNTSLDPNTNYNNYIYSFPLVIGRKEVATITLVNLYHNSDSRDDLMLKYFGKDDFNISWWTFSHDTYLDCYLTIHEEFELPEIVKGFFAGKFQVTDANGKPFYFSVSYGYPENENESYIRYQWINDKTTYRFDNDVNIDISVKPTGWSLGKKINDNIETRLIPYKRDEKINTLIK